MTTVVFHANCRDGFAAAWAIRTVYPEATFIAGNFGKPLEGFPFAGQDVIFADFSLPRSEMLQIAEKAATMRVFDHHKTAEEALRDFPTFDGKVKIVFDMERSGAGISWDELNPGVPRPWIIDRPGAVMFCTECDGPCESRGHSRAWRYDDHETHVQAHLQDMANSKGAYWS